MPGLHSGTHPMTAITVCSEGRGVVSEPVWGLASRSKCGHRSGLCVWLADGPGMLQATTPMVDSGVQTRGMQWCSGRGSQDPEAPEGLLQCAN